MVVFFDREFLFFFVYLPWMKKWVNEKDWIPKIWNWFECIKERKRTKRIKVSEVVEFSFHMCQEGCIQLPHCDQCLREKRSRRTKQKNNKEKDTRRMFNRPHKLSPNNWNCLEEHFMFIVAICDIIIIFVLATNSFVFSNSISPQSG